MRTKERSSEGAVNGARLSLLFVLGMACFFSLMGTFRWTVTKSESTRKDAVRTSSSLLISILAGLAFFSIHLVEKFKRIWPLMLDIAVVLRCVNLAPWGTHTHGQSSLLCLCLPLSIPSVDLRLEWASFQIYGLYAFAALRRSPFVSSTICLWLCPIVVSKEILLSFTQSHYS